MAQHTYIPEGVCSKHISFETSHGIVKNVQFKEGCHANLQGISRLLEGLPADEVIRKLRGIDCRGKGTSCVDQLAKALEKAASSSSEGPSSEPR